MPENETSFTIDLPITGREKIDAAAMSVDVLAAKLGDVSKASQAATAALKVGEGSYNAAERAANMAAKAVERIGVAQAAAKDKIKTAGAAGDDKAVERAYDLYDKLSKRKEEASAKSDKFKASLVAEAAALDKLKASAASAVDAEAKLSKALDEKKKSSTKGDDEDGPAYEKIARGLGKLGGPLAEVGEKVAKVGSGFEKLKAAFGGSAGAIVGTTVLVVALVAAMVALAVAAVSTTLRIVEWSVGLADANRQSRLLAEGMAHSVKGGDALNESVKQIARQFPVSTEQLSELAKGFVYAGYHGQNLTNALQHAAQWAARLKFGPDFKAEMLSLDEQSKVLHLNLAQTFGGLKIDGLLGALQKMIALLDSSTESGNAIKTVFESLFQPLIDGAVGAQYKVEAFFLDMEIWALKTLIFLKPHTSTIIKIGEAFAIGGAVIAASIILVVGAFVALAALLPTIFVGLSLLGQWIGEKIAGWIQAVVKAAPAFLEAGKAMIEGLVQGIVSSGSKVFDALKGIVTSAVKGVQGILQINSPSKVFAHIGASTGEGMALGVDRSAPAVRNSLEELVEPPSPGSVATAPNTSAAPKTAGANFAGAQFILNGIKGADDAVSRIGDLLTVLMEGDAAKLGAMVASA